jgi:hypothetical protein
MTSFPRSPKVLRAGIVVIDAESAQVRRIITLQYNPDAMTRTLQAQAAGGDSTTRSEPLRFKGAAVETINLTADIDATDQLEFPEQNADAVASGIQPQLALLETLMHPTSAQLIAVDQEASSGTLEITPMLAPLPLLVWGKNRIVPVRITTFSVSEQAYSPMLDPIRATVTLGLRVLTVDDLGFSSKGGGLFMSYLQLKEQLAGKAPPGAFVDLGIGGLP